MPGITTEKFAGRDDMPWLGSAHGLRNARTETLDVSAFTAADHYPDGYFKSGLPVAKVAGCWHPTTRTSPRPATLGCWPGSC